MLASDALSIYFEEHAQYNCVAWARQQSAIKRLNSFLGDTPVDEIDARKTKSYAESRKAQNSTVRRELNVLVAAVNYCVKWGHLPRSAANTLYLPPAHAQTGEETKWFTPDEIKLLLQEADGDLRNFITLAYFTGARRAAIENLTIPQIKLQEKRIYLLTPGKRQTKKRMPVVPIFKEIESVLPTMIGSRSEGYLFNPRRQFYRPFVNLCARLDLEDKGTPHALRHSRATHLLQNGATLFQVAKLLGDTVRTIEAVYGHHCPDFLNETL